MHIGDIVHVDDSAVSSLDRQIVEGVDLGEHARRATRDQPIRRRVSVRHYRSASLLDPTASLLRKRSALFDEQAVADARIILSYRIKEQLSGPAEIGLED